MAASFFLRPCADLSGLISTMPSLIPLRFLRENKVVSLKQEVMWGRTMDCNG